MPVIGAIQESLSGPGTITHEGGDVILIAEVQGGLPQPERTLVFEGEEVVVDGDDEFQPAPSDARSAKIGETVLIRALGQATYNFEEGVSPEGVEFTEDEEAVSVVTPKPKAKKRAAKKKASLPASGGVIDAEGADAA